MTFRFHPWQWVKHVAHEVYVFFGPVKNGIKGRVNQDEVARVAVKAFTVGATSAAGAWELIKDSDFQSAILIPCVAAFMAGLLEYMSRKQQGVEPLKEVPNVAPGTE